MKTHLYFLLLLLIALLLACLCQRPSPVEEPMATPESVSPKSVPTEAPTPAATPTATPTLTDTSVSTNTAEPTPTDTPVPRTNTPTVVPPTNTPGPSTDDLVGILCSGEAGFGQVKGLGSEMTSFPGPRGPQEFLALLDAAQAHGLKLIARGPGSTAFTDGTKLNFDELRTVTENLYGGNDIARHPAYGGWYIIDEPCADWLYDIMPAEMQQFYETIKSVDSDIVVIVNFSWLECARNLDAANATDIAAFTYTVARTPGHFASQAALAEDLKMANPDLKVVPWIGVWEYPAKGVPIPSAEWTRDRGMEALQYPVFDGVMYYPWQPSAGFFGATIQDVADDPEYISAFNDVFDAAMEKFGGE